MEKEYVYRYYWIALGKPQIEMAGLFTESRWKGFCKNPHPIQRNIKIILIERKEYN